MIIDVQIGYNLCCQSVKQQTQKMGEKMKQMQDLHSLEPKQYNEKKVLELMPSTYYSQKISINKKKFINDILEKWPFLFFKNGLINHFNELVGMDISEKLSQVKNETIMAQFAIV